MNLIKTIDAELHHACLDIERAIYRGKPSHDRITPKLTEYAIQLQLWSDAPGWNTFYAELERVLGPHQAAKTAPRHRTYGISSKTNIVGYYRGVNLMLADRRPRLDADGYVLDGMGCLNLAMGDKLLVSIPLYTPKVDDDGGLEEQRYKRKLGAR